MNQTIGKAVRFASVATGLTVLVAYGVKLAFGEEIPQDVKGVIEAAIAWGLLYAYEHLRQHRKHGWKR